MDIRITGIFKWEMKKRLTQINLIGRSIDHLLCLSPLLPTRIQ